MMYDLLDQLRKLDKPPTAEEKALDPQMKLLRAWQTERLRRTYADFLTNPRYRPATTFFLTDIYGARDFSQRDQAIEQIYQSMHRLLPESMLHTLILGMQLNELTQSLDRELLDALVNKLGVTDTIAPEQVSQAYRICDNYDERSRQIDLIVEVGQGIDRLVHIPLVGMTLRLARRPAEWAGWGEFHDILARGYEAFKGMGKADAFLDTIERRERWILERIFAGDENPFESANMI